MSIKSIDLFVGAGGLALGAARAGFEITTVVDHDVNACKTLRSNQIDGVQYVRDWNIIERDARACDFKCYSDEIEVVFGGPPCQPFSLGGKHRSHDDDRNMFPIAIRAICDIRPNAFIFENVKGILRTNFAKYFNYIIHQLRFPDVTIQKNEKWYDHLLRLEKLYTNGKYPGLHYNVFFESQNAADFGIPQKRERVFIVGIQADHEVNFRFPTNTHSFDALLYDQWISGEYWDRHKISKSEQPDKPIKLKRRIEQLLSCDKKDIGKPWRTVRDVISDLQDLCISESTTTIRNHFLNPGARSYVGHDGSSWDEPAKTLKAGYHGVPGGENTLRLGNGNVRYFSVRECARLQTFPDEWTFEGSWTQSMRQEGNAVPVDLASTISLSVLNDLNIEK